MDRLLFYYVFNDITNDVCVIVVLDTWSSDELD